MIKLGKKILKTERKELLKFVTALRDSCRVDMKRYARQEVYAAAMMASSQMIAYDVVIRQLQSRLNAAKESK